MTDDEQGQAEAMTGHPEVGGRHRRAFGEDEKKSIVREARAGGHGGAATVAAQYGIAPNLMYRWMKKYAEDVDVAGVEVEYEGVESIIGRIDELQGEITELKGRLADMVEIANKYLAP